MTSGEPAFELCMNYTCYGYVSNTPATSGSIAASSYARVTTESLCYAGTSLHCFTISSSEVLYSTTSPESLNCNTITTTKASLYSSSTAISYPQESSSIECICSNMVTNNSSNDDATTYAYMYTTTSTIVPNNTQSCLPNGDANTLIIGCAVGGTIILVLITINVFQLCYIITLKNKKSSKYLILVSVQIYGYIVSKLNSMM